MTFLIDRVLGGAGMNSHTSMSGTFLVPRYYYVVEVLKEYPELSRGAY